MKKRALLLTLFIFVAMTWVSCINITGEAPTGQSTDALALATTVATIEPATPTPEVFIAMTRAIPGEFQPTAMPAPTATQPPTITGTTVTYQLLTITIPLPATGEFVLSFGYTGITQYPCGLIRS